jgi:hypothetical protein
MVCSGKSGGGSGTAIKLTIDEEVVEDAGRGPDPAVRPATDAGAALVKDKDGTRVDGAAFTVVQPAGDHGEDALAAGLEDEEGIEGGLDVTSERRLGSSAGGHGTYRGARYALRARTPTNLDRGKQEFVGRVEFSGCRTETKGRLGGGNRGWQMPTQTLSVCEATADPERSRRRSARGDRRAAEPFTPAQASLAVPRPKGISGLGSLPGPRRTRRPSPAHDIPLSESLRPCVDSRGASGAHFSSARRAHSRLLAVWGQADAST